MWIKKLKKEHKKFKILAKIEINLSKYKNDKSCLEFLYNN